MCDKNNIHSLDTGYRWVAKVSSSVEGGTGTETVSHWAAGAGERLRPRLLDRDARPHPSDTEKEQRRGSECCISSKKFKNHKPRSIFSDKVWCSTFQLCVNSVPVHSIILTTHMHTHTHSRTHTHAHICAGRLLVSTGWVWLLNRAGTCTQVGH